MKSENPDHPYGIDSLELYAWLAVGRLPGVGAVTFQNLLGQCSELKQVFSFPASRLQSLGLKAPAIDLLQSTSLQQLATLEPLNPLVAGVAQDVHWARVPGHHILCYHDPRYPALLREIHDPPPCLFVIGDPAQLNAPQLAVIGSRNPSQSGLMNTRNFARYLAQQGWVISSGLALGIDGEAHQAALDAGGVTLAVAGHSLDYLYPKQHGALAQAIVQKGAMVSEYPVGTAPKPHLFARRNRIISGLSQGVLVVEATLKSGSLITAQMALEQGREVFAIPGSIHNPLSRGCHKLIKQGATLVESGEDIFNQLGAFVSPTPKPRSTEPVQTPAKSESLPRTEKKAAEHTQLDLLAAEDNFTSPSMALSAEEKQLLRFLDLDPLPFDFIVERSNLEVNQVASLLVLLELKELVFQEAGGYSRRPVQESS